MPVSRCLPKIQLYASISHLKGVKYVIPKAFPSSSLPFLYLLSNVIHAALTDKHGVYYAVPRSGDVAANADFFGFVARVNLSSAPLAARGVITLRRVKPAVIPNR
jgi:hypothetical protein